MHTERTAAIEPLATPHFATARACCSRTRVLMLALCALIASWMLWPYAAFAADCPVTENGAAIYHTSAPASSFGDAASSLAGEVAVSDDGTEALLEGCSFGFSDFARYNVGTSRTAEGFDYGYRWPSAGADAFSVIVDETSTVVYIPQAALDAIDADISDAQFQKDFLTTLFESDSANAKGGKLFSDICTMYISFTSADTVDMYYCGGGIYKFGEEIEDGYYYTTVSKTDSHGGAVEDFGSYALSGKLADASNLNIQAQDGFVSGLSKLFEKLDWSPLWVSLRTTLVATFVIFILGLLAAWGTVQVSERVKGVLDTVFTIPMVLPPTVCGFLLLLLFGNSTDVGRWLIAHGIDIVFTWPAAVIACVVVGFPLMYRTARGAFENLEPNMLDAARTLGWSERRIFARIMLPLAWPSIAAGTVLAFARAMGEFGATLFVAGNFAGVTQTMPIAIYFAWMGGSPDVAMFWVVVVILISFVIILIINIYTSHVARYRNVGGKRTADIAELVENNEVSFSIDEAAAEQIGFTSTKGASR